MTVELPSAETVTQTGSMNAQALILQQLSLPRLLFSGKTMTYLLVIRRFRDIALCATAVHTRQRLHAWLEQQPKKFRYDVRGAVCPWNLDPNEVIP